MKILRNPVLPEIEIKDGAEEFYSVKKHSHKELSIGLIENGSSSVSCSEFRFEMNPGDLILIPPDSVHLCSPEKKDRFLFKMIYLDSAWLGSVFDLAPEFLMPIKVKLKKQEINFIRNFLNNFQLKTDRMELETNLIFLLEEIFFNIFKITPTFAENSKNLQPDSVKKYLDENFIEELTLSDLEKISGQSRFSILRKFRSKYKLTPHAYIINKRIEIAKKMILENRSVARTAADSGFFDQSHFIKTFKKYVGMNPSEYK